MNSHANRDRSIVPKRSSAFGELGRVHTSSKVQQTGNHRWRQGQGAQNKLQVWPMSREEPREKDQQTTYSQSSAAQRPDQQLSCRASNEYKEGKALATNHHDVHRNTHDAGWRMGKAKKVVEDTGG